MGATYPFLAVYVVCDAVSAALGGGLTGAGNQRLAAVVVLGSYGVVGLPICALLAFGLGAGYIGIVVGI